MATNAEQIFEMTMSLMDELNESTGKPDTADTREYKNRTIPILNVLRGEVYPYSDTYARDVAAGKRPICPIIINFTDAMPLDDYICQSVLPCGLAAHLLMQEDPTAANFFQQRYDELKAMLARGMPAESVDIEDIYGGNSFPHNNYGWW